MVRSVGSSLWTRRRGFAPRRSLAIFYTPPEACCRAHHARADSRLSSDARRDRSRRVALSRARPCLSVASVANLPTPSPAPRRIRVYCAGKHPQDATMSFAVSASAACSAAVGARALKVRPPFIRVALRVVLARGESSIPGLRPSDLAWIPPRNQQRDGGKCDRARPSLTPPSSPTPQTSRNASRARSTSRGRGRRPRRRLRRHG